MRFQGKLYKDGKFWLVEVPVFAAMTQGLADPAAPIDAANLTVDELIVDESGAPGTAHVIAAVSFPWRGTTTIPMRALEWFTIRDGKVSEIQVFLWDTGAAVSALGTGPG